MNYLGVYFGPQLVSIVETKGSKIVNYIQVSLAAISAGEALEEKVPTPIKLVTLLKDELMKNSVEANEAIVSLSGKDLIVRTFDMPILPRQELDTAVNFEVKKYIPFKVEDLISDFQYKVDKGIQKTRVLFVGIKKEALDNYLSILSQLDIRIKSIEYSAFSILRLLKLSNIKEKGVTGIVNIDLTKEDEANFVVMDRGFPLFSRDITLMGGYGEAAKEEEAQEGVILEKIKREIQISLDYYDRKFSGKSISKLFFITNPECRAELDGFIKELGLIVNFIDINKHLDNPVPFSLPFVKAYSSSLSRINIGVKINLLLAKERVTKKLTQEALTSLVLLKRFKSDIIVVAACLLVIIAVSLSGVYRAMPLQNELNSIMNTRPAISGVSGNLSYKELLSINSDYKTKVETLDNIMEERIYVTPILDAIPRVVPRGIRLSGLAFKLAGQRMELALEGTAYLADSDKEIELVGAFLSRLRQNPALNKYFKDMSIVSTGHKQADRATVTAFRILCQGTRKGAAIK